MFRLALTLGLVLAVAPLALADDDPEPPAKRSPHTATSGDYTIKALKNGSITASNKKGQLIWTTSLKEAGQDVQAQVAIEGEYVIVGGKGTVYALDLTTGKMYWRRNGTPDKAVLTVKDGRVTLKAGGNAEVIELRTGRLMERVRGKR